MKKFWLVLYSFISLTFFAELFFYDPMAAEEAFHYYLSHTLLGIWFLDMALVELNKPRKRNDDVHRRGV